MSEDKEKSDLIAVTKNQALGVGGAGVAITTIVALTSTFLTKGDKDALQAQISQNKAAIQYMQNEIKEGFKEQKLNLKEAVKEIEKVLHDAARDRWTSKDHDRYAERVDSRLKRLEKQVEDLQK
jgi:FtsZ-binding cell division protein ZapB